MSTFNLKPNARPTVVESEIDDLFVYSVRPRDSFVFVDALLDGTDDREFRIYVDRSTSEIAWSRMANADSRLTRYFAEALEIAAQVADQLQNDPL